MAWPWPGRAGAVLLQTSDSLSPSSGLIVETKPIGPVHLKSRETHMEDVW